MSRQFQVTIAVLAILAIVVIFGVRRRHAVDAPRNGREWCVTDMAKIQVAMDRYFSQYGKYPSEVSNNFFCILSGDNPNKIVFLERWISKTNPAGEWLDWWGAPYKIEMMDQTNFIIRSAGANGRLGDADDYNYDNSKVEFTKPD